MEADTDLLNRRVVRPCRRPHPAREGIHTVGPDDIVFLGSEAMKVTLLASAPMLISGMVVGLVISIFQSATQIQEITLTFVPKIIIVFIAFVLFLPWMIEVVITFVRPIFGNFTQWIG